VAGSKAGFPYVGAGGQPGRNQNLGQPLTSKGGFLSIRNSIQEKEQEESTLLNSADIAIPVSVTGKVNKVIRASQNELIDNRIGISELAAENNAAPNVDQAFTVNQATPIITWANPADITYGTALSGTQLNAAASVPGGFVYTPAAGTVLSAGANQILHAAFTPTDTTNYTVASKNVIINVTGTLPSILYINGTVTNNTLLGEPLAGVTVTTGSQTTTTGPDGKYSFAVVSGSYDLTFNKNDIRYYTGSLNAVSTVSGDANGDFALQLKPVGTISGTVTVV